MSEKREGKEEGSEKQEEVWCTGGCWVTQAVPMNYNYLQIRERQCCENFHSQLCTYMDVYKVIYTLTFSGDEVSGDERWPVTAIHYQGDTL